MEYDSASSCEERLKDLEDCEASKRNVETNERAESQKFCRSSASPRWYDPERPCNAETAILPAVAKKTLSSQVMEYYQRYSQNSGLGRYFSLAEQGSTARTGDYVRTAYGQDSRVIRDSRAILAEDETSRLESSLPRERRRWARPPLIGQPSASEETVTSPYADNNADSRTPSPVSKRPTTETIREERNEEGGGREILVETRDNDAKPSISPTSSVASHKPLEWDSGADVGYYNALLLPRTREKDKKLCTIERMALARGRSAALRLDPEGTNESNASSHHGTKNFMKPDANSTPLVGHASVESDDEIEITPIVKNHSTLVTKVHEEKSPEIDAQNGAEIREKTIESRVEETKATARSLQIKYLTDGSSRGETRRDALKKSSSMNLPALPSSRLSLKRSQSELNLRAGEKNPLPLKFDSTSSIATVVNKPATCDKFMQTSLDDCSRESIGIQVETMSREEDQRFSDIANDEIDDKTKIKSNDDNEEDEEEKPPLPKRASSLIPKSLHSILKNSSNTYNARDRNISISGARNNDRKFDFSREKNQPEVRDDSVDGTALGRARSRTRGGGNEHPVLCASSSEQSRNETSSTRSEILVEETTEENATGRASDSFEYFPGHVYQNLPNGSTSQISTCDTGRESRCSTMPNTSSSIDEKLWGNSDSLVRDLERSVNILKSLVDANKCDKQVKKRLIHHVIKRLVTAKYTDDLIERELEENVPWNPADARNKVYRNDIIQALASKKQQNTTDSSAEDWLPRKRNAGRVGNNASPRKNLTKSALREMIDLAASSRESTINSDKFPFDRLNDGTVMDGRKARMGLRSEDRGGDTNTDGDKSQSSECFVPQSQRKHKIKSTNVYYSIERGNEKLSQLSQNFAGDSSTTMTTTAMTTAMTTTTAITTTMTSTTTTTSATSSMSIGETHGNPMSDRIVLVRERRRNESNETDWKLPATMSEKRFELGRCSNSESGDTKLINYAEIEKKNQLVWITNEISHLCNLKRLLEEPNKFEGRSRSGNSPRKRSGGLPIGQWIVQSQAERNSLSRTERERGTGSEAPAVNIPRNESLEKQWSSHGNLANFHSEIRVTKKRDDEQRVGHTRKRNSCTQTGSDGGPSGHSKTGGEIVSAALPILVSSARMDRETRPIMRDAFSQTPSNSPENITKGLPTSGQVNHQVDPSRFGRSSNCTNRVKTQSNDDDDDEKTCKRSQRHVCYCQRYAAHSRHRACIIHSPQKTIREHSKNCPQRSSLRRDERPIISQPIVTQIPASSSKSMDTRKETKNQLNATCKSNYAIRELPGRGREGSRCARCDEEKISSLTKIGASTLKTTTKDLQNDDSMEIFVCPSDCSCEDERSESTGNEDNHEKNEEIASPCCETKSKIEAKTRRCENLSSRARCACNIEKNSSSDGEVDEAGRGNSNFRKNVESTEARDIEKTCKSCRTCGTIWPVKDGKNANRRCKCSQDYLKPVAYELKFDETIREKPRNKGGKKTTKTDKIVTKGLSNGTKTQTKATQSAPIDEDPPRDDFDCDEECQNDEDKHEDFDERRGTLKDFLATNRPEFLESVETRRRYMSELAQLRQMKREKRKQFLAMAGTSGFLKPQRPAKVSTANTQRKLSEYELKLRLRMRYLRLGEVRNKRRQREKEEDAKRNHLMAKLFGQKLQQKVLKGQVDLSQSVSVISNL